MKNITFLFALLFACAISFAQEKFQPKELRGSDAEKIWKGAEHIWLKQENTVPSFIQFRSGSEPDEAGFFAMLKKTFVLPSSYNFQLKNSETDQLGWQNKRYQLTVNNVPVGNGIFLLHLINGKVKKYNGYLFTHAGINTSASLSETSALTFALKDVKATTYKWQLPGEEAFLKQESGDANATFYPKGELEILQVGGNTSNVFKLVWKFDIYAHEPMSRQYIYIDAQSGEVLKRSNRIHEANTNGTAVTAYRGSRAIVADSYNGAYRLYETTRGLGVRTRNLQRGTSYTNAVEFTDADNVWNNVNANLDQYAGDAHWGAEMTYDFYQTMGRNSINGNGLLLNLYVHYSVGYVNAFWDGTRMTFGDGDGTYDPLTPLDITAHEVTHGLTQYTADLDYSYESGALNESFSDIFGAAVEWFADSVQADWTIAEDIGPIFRSMSNPNTHGDPDTYTGTNWYTGTNDNGGVHTNSAVQNHWYYRLVMGGNGTNDLGNAFNVTGIGRAKANQIAWRNLVTYLSSSSDYADARFYAIQAANDLFGACSQEVVSTTKAWYAVGVGTDYLAGADAQFIASPVYGCTLPFTVNFSNTSSNANSYLWSFGDGTTSTVTNPVHVYSVNGLYTVKLVANGGGTCGSDSVTYVNLINVNTSNPCSVTLPTTGTYQTQTSCSGTFYDSGGPSSNYTGNTSSVLTIAPTGAAQVTLHFTQFDMEDGYDYLYVYDGPTTASPVIGSYTGQTIPADITSTGSSITVRQFSDPFVEGAGFAVQWTCVVPVVTPVANFKADVTQSCTGAIKFTDLTANGVTSWLWNFGDGNTSTLQHPSHVYETNGAFTVSLLATNAFGNNTATKNNYITISKPAGPSLSDMSSCGPNFFTLTNGNGNRSTWFNESGNVVANASPYVPYVTSTTTYFVQDTVEQPTFHVGPVSNTAVGSSGGNFNNNATLGLKFNVSKKAILESVLVYATGDGYRTIQYRDSIGGIISQKSVFIPNGSSRVTLNIDLIPGGPYLLRLKDTTNLYRNSVTSCCVYPFSDANGIVTITGNNAPTAPYNYYYFYDWEVREHDCISLKEPVVVTIKPEVTASSSFTNVSCFGGSTGTVSVTPQGGTPGFTYHWSNNATSSSISNVPAGLYLVTVTDAQGCTALSGQTISEPTAVVPSAIVTNVSCHEGNNGSIILDADGGTPGYTFNWGGGITTPNRTALTAGTYTATITDANSCSVTSSAIVNEPTAISVSAAATDVLCFGENTGTITLTVSGGTSGYNFNWGGGITSQNRTALAAGTYTATITDANSCSAVSSAFVDEPIALTASSTFTNLLCNGDNTGTITLTASGGTPGYSFNWGGGVTSQNRTALAAGTYSATISDANSCSAVSSVTINEPPAIAVSTSVTNVLCNGDNNGTIQLAVSGGASGYDFVWDDGFTLQNRTALTAGTYSATITDANSCSAVASATITEPPVFGASAIRSHPSCNLPNGSISVTASGGIAGYSYLWDQGQTDSSLSNLAAGNYFLTVSDNNACSFTLTITLNSSSALTANISVIDASCFGSADGSAEIAVGNGVQPFTYLWSNGAVDSFITNVTAGTYSATVTDGTGCSTTVTPTINEPAALSVSISATDAACNQNNGSAIAVASGGTSTYSYLWSNTETSDAIANLSPDSYSVTATDSRNCTATSSAIILNASSLVADVTLTNATCFGSSDGTASVNIASGTQPFIFSWNNGEDSSTINDLTAGEYLITVTDGSNCQYLDTIVITAPEAISISLNVTDVSCNGLQNGSAAATASGGNSNYSFNWSDNTSGNNLTNIGAGNYSVTASDARGCSSTSAFAINEPASILVSASAVDALCFGSANGSATATVSGGSPSYTYQWCNGNTTSVANNLSAGNCSVTVADANGCNTTTNVVINEPSEIQFTTSVTDAVTGVNNGAVNVSVSGGASPFSYSWNDGTTTEDRFNLGAGTYSFTITDANNCQKTGSVVVNAITGLDQLNNELSFTVYPNPASDEVFVVMNEWKEKSSLSLKNVLGQILLNQTISSATSAIDLSSFAEGIYFLEVKQGEAKAIKEIVISR